MISKGIEDLEHARRTYKDVHLDVFTSRCLFVYLGFDFPSVTCECNAVYQLTLESLPRLTKQPMNVTDPKGNARKIWRMKAHG